MATYLRYVGNGRWLPGSPAADHEVETTEEADRLVASGLYGRYRATGADESDDGAAVEAPLTPFSDDSDDSDE